MVPHGTVMSTRCMAFIRAFPTHWAVVECRMGGHDRPTRAEAEMRREVCR